MALLAALDDWLAPSATGRPAKRSPMAQHALEPHQKLDEAVFEAGASCSGSDLVSRCADAPEVDWAAVRD